MIGYVNLIMYLFGISIVLVVGDFIINLIVGGLTKLTNIIMQKLKKKRGKSNG